LIMQTTPRSSESQRALGRVFRMGIPELVYRGRQQTFKWVERLGAGVIGEASRADDEGLSRFIQSSEKHFFEGPFDPRLSAELAIAAPHHCEDVFAIAEEIRRGRFNLLGYRDLDLGMDPDWHLEPISKRRAPSVHWSRIDPLDRSIVGDSKIIWELNRHQWLVQLAQSYRLSGDERDAETVVRHLQSWVRNNPHGIGINWASSLEVAFRLIAWCWTLVLIRDSRALTPDVFAELLASVRAHATHVERYLSYYFSPNTHLTGEALGLFYASVVFPELARAEHWRSLASGILQQEIGRQILSDGVYFERSTCYQRYTVDIYLHFLILAGRAGIDLPPAVSQAVRSMIDVLVTLRQPDGSVPSIGDADGGTLLPLGSRQPDDFRATFSTAAILFDEPVYAWAAAELAPETLWLFGTQAAKNFERIEKAQPAADLCRIFPAGGFAVMRSGWDRNAHSLILDAGPLGCPVSSGHGHADLLSIQCSAFGEKYLVDAGTGSYADPELRDFFRGTAAHSTVMIDGKSQAEPAGPFSWHTRCAARLLRWISTDTFTFADAEHDAYSSLSDPVVHRRRVAFIKSRYWIVIDDLTGSEPHRIDVRFQFAPMQIQIDRAGWVRATRNHQRHGLLLRAFASAPFDAAVREARRDPMEGWVSPDYGQMESAPVVVYTATAQLPVRIVTLLWPADNVGETPRFDVMYDTHGRPSGLTLHDRKETLLFDEGEPVIFHQP
jgi:hypothetical protein